MENGHHRKAENKLYQGTKHYTTHQMHIFNIYIYNFYCKQSARIYKTLGCFNIGIEIIITIIINTDDVIIIIIFSINFNNFFLLFLVKQ